MTSKNTPTEPTENDRKRQKKEKSIDPNRCEFIIVNKKRRCGMMRQKGERFCLDHLKQELTDKDKINQERIPCPLDPKHSVWAKELEVHLKKCNARPKESHEYWYQQHFNTHIIGYAKDNDNGGSKVQVLEEQNEQILSHVIEKLKIYGKNFTPIEERIKQHRGLDSWVESKYNKKHILQQSSLAGLLDESQLLSADNFYVEFGCGKAELSRTINACILSETIGSKQTYNSYGYGFIDRGTNRMKTDSKILTDCSDSVLSPIIKRSRIDIEHLVIDKFLESVNPSAVVGISKHLCGVATDLTLKCLLNLSTTLANFKGLVVAMCCRHACNYNQLLPESKSYLKDNGIEDETMFNVLKKVVTWAVCGTMTEQKVTSDLQEREKLGFIARTIIDNSRVYAINKSMPGFQAELLRYVKTDVTLENHCLRITRKAHKHT